jgi:hypothetical protein
MGRLSAVDLLNKVACFVKECKLFVLSKGAYLNGRAQYS